MMFVITSSDELCWLWAAGDTGAPVLWDTSEEVSEESVLSEARTFPAATLFNTSHTGISSALTTAHAACCPQG